MILALFEIQKPVCVTQKINIFMTVILKKIDPPPYFVSNHIFCQQVHQVACFLQNPGNVFKTLLTKMKPFLRLGTGDK